MRSSSPIRRVTARSAAAVALVYLMSLIGVTGTASAQSQRADIRELLSELGYEKIQSMPVYIKGDLQPAAFVFDIRVAPEGTLTTLLFNVFADAEGAMEGLEETRRTFLDENTRHQPEPIPFEGADAEGWAGQTDEPDVDKLDGDLVYGRGIANGAFRCGNVITALVHELGTERYPEDDDDAAFDDAASKALEAFELIRDTILPSLVDAFLEANVCGTSWELLPEGIAYDVIHPNTDAGPDQSIFTDLTVVGSGLADVSEVVFEPSVDLYPMNVRASENEVKFDMEVVHGAELGERRLLLRTSDGKEIDATEKAGKRFAVTKMRAYFNQAVNQEELETEAHHDRLVAYKKGVMRLFIEDPLQNGRSFAGGLLLKQDSDDLTSQSQQDLLVQGGYTPQEIKEGRDYLTIPLPEPGADGIPPGEHTFKCVLASDEARSFFCPDVKRRFVESRPIRLRSVRFTYTEDDGTVLNPAPQAAVESGMDFLKSLLPVSATAFEYADEGSAPLPVVEMTTSMVTYSNGSEATVKRLSSNGEWELARTVRDEYGRDGEIVIGFVPNSFLDQDRSGDGKIDFFVAGSAFSRHCVFLISRSSGFEATLAHEIGHMLGSCVEGGPRGGGATAARPTLDLGEEYDEGYFYNCDVNPPVQEVKEDDYQDEVFGLIPGETACPDSPFRNGLHGTLDGTFAARSGFDVYTMTPKLYASGVDTFYNVMAGGVHKRWVSRTVYDRLVEGFMDVGTSKASPMYASASGVIDVAGIIHRDGSASFDNFFIRDGGLVDPDSAGPYTIELRDAAGSVLDSRSFSLMFVSGSEPPYETDAALFRMRLPYADGSRRVVLLRNGSVMAERMLGDAAPTVEITSPQAGATLSGEVELRWDASDSDGGDLNYKIILSAAGKEFVVDALVTETSYRLDLSPYAPASAASIRIVANDGLNESEASVSNLTLQAVASPSIAAVDPAFAPQYSNGLTVTLTGSQFASGPSVSFSGTGIVVREVSYVDDGRIDALIDVAYDAPLGARDVTVTNPDGGHAVLPAAFEVTAFAGLPVTLSWSAPPPGETLIPPQDLVIGAGGSAGKRQHRLAASPRAAAVTEAKRSGAVQVQADSDEIEPNNGRAEAQVITGASPISVHGNAEVDDEGHATITFDNGSADDLEDVYRITTTAPGLLVTLDGFGSDLDLYVADEELTYVVGVSNTVGADYDEEVDAPDLTPGTYLIAVSIYDPDPDGPNESPYVLTVTAQLEGTSSGPILEAFHIYRSGQPNPISTGDRIATVTPDTRQFTDVLFDNATYYYRVTAQYDQGESAGSNETSYLVNVGDDSPGELPLNVTLIGNYPNPFNPTTRIVFELPSPGDVRLVVYDVLGREVARLVDGVLAVGRHEVAFDASDLPSGIYLYRLQAGTEVRMRTMTLVR